MASDIVMNVGEALVGEGNEIAHIDLLIGSKTGPVGTAFANALANQSDGHSNLAGCPHAELARQARDRAHHQGHDQRNEAGCPDVRAGAVCGRQGRGRQRG